MHHSHLDEHIIHIIQNHTVCEQGELQSLLKEQGQSVPQPTLSRRLKKLNISKISGVYHVIDDQSSIKSPILHIDVSDFGMIVLHTSPGHAGSVAYIIDQQNITGVLGSIAGDDTVLIIAQNNMIAAEIVTKIQKVKP